jgi:hypothetical protein
MNKITLKTSVSNAVIGLLFLGLAACGGGAGSSTSSAAPPKLLATTVTSSFKHPGVLFDQAQLDFIKAQVNAGVEPYATAFNVAKTSSYGAIPYTVIGPPANGVIECGSSSVPDYGCTAERNDSSAAYTQALLWYITGNTVYAQQAIAIMNTYATRLTGGHTNSNAPLQSAWTVEKFAPAAEIIRHTYSGWAAADIAKFSTMLNTQYLPYFNAGQGNGKNGNWSLSMIDAMMGIGVFNDDTATFNQAVSMWPQWVKGYFYSSANDGGAPYTFSGGPTGWNGQTVFNSATSGVSQETCRDTQHVGMGMAAAFNAAETALVQGTDLYTPQKTRLTAALEYHSKILMGVTNTSQTAYVSASAFSGLCTGAGNQYVPVLKGTMERAYNTLHNKMGWSLPLTQQHILNDIRPKVTTSPDLWIAMDQHDVVWETLTNAGSPAPTTITANGDAYTRDGGYSDTNFGTEINLVAKTSTLGFNRHAYVRFNIPGIDSVVGAKLRIYGSASYDTDLTASQQSLDWSSTTITWNNAPAPGTSISTVPVTTSAKYYEVDVTPYLRSQVAGGAGSVAFMLSEGSGAVITLNSSNNTDNKPQLVIAR